MENILAGLNLKIYCVFIDDVIIFGKVYDELLHNLQLVSDRIKTANLKILKDFDLMVTRFHVNHGEEAVS
jgi:hypothetical protein